MVHLLLILMIGMFFLQCVATYTFHNEQTIDPTLTDPLITRALSGPGFGDHKVFVKSGANGDQLYVHLSGSTGQPRFSRYVTNAAAEQGLFAIGLAYSNADSYQNICAGKPTESCQYLSRVEDTTGEDVSMYKSTSVADSIENRLLKLLVYLHAASPATGWDRFFNGQNISWTKILIGGHSQGAGTAQIVSMIRPVARVLKFAGGVYLTPSSYPGIYAFITPQQIYSFTHTADGSYAGIQVVDDLTLQLSQFGPASSVDGSAAPFGGSHKLSTSRASSNPHGAVAGDTELAFDGNGSPVYDSVWRFMITSTSGASKIFGFLWLSLVMVLMVVLGSVISLE